MKINNKGFMLAEVVVVSVVIAMILVTSFTGLNRVSHAFETRNNYFDIDCEYLAIEINNYYIKNSEINTFVKNGNSAAMNINNIASAYSGYNSINAYFSLYTEAKIKNLKSLRDSKQTIKDYVDYFSGHYDFSEEYSYVIITEMCKTADDCKYYGLRVR